jgi:hypothetical protein
LATVATAKSAAIQTMKGITPKIAKTVNSNRRAIATTPITRFLCRTLSCDKLGDAGISIPLHSTSKVLIKEFFTFSKNHAFKVHRRGIKLKKKKLNPLLKCIIVQHTFFKAASEKILYSDIRYTANLGYL